MSEYTKPKYKNLIKYLHDRNHYLDVDSFTAENRVELLSNFIMLPKKCNDGGKCFCSRVLKNVFFVTCILTKEPMMVGGGCKSLFTPRNKKKHKQQFLDRTLHLFKNNLGWERIIDWNDFIGQSLDTYLRNASYSELQRLQELYKDNQNILDRINQYCSSFNKTYQNFLDDIENNMNMNLYIEEEEYKSYWLKYLQTNHYDRINILTKWFSLNLDVYNYIKPLINEKEDFDRIIQEQIKKENKQQLEEPSEYAWFLKRMEWRGAMLEETLLLYSIHWKYYLRTGNRDIILAEWKERNKKIYKFIKELIIEMGI